jgi:hypothetical protein
LAFFVPIDGNKELPALDKTILAVKKLKSHQIKFTQMLLSHILVFTT